MCKWALDDTAEERTAPRPLHHNVHVARRLADLDLAVYMYGACGFRMWGEVIPALAQPYL